ncbi:MAG TPA: thioredoxin domain-containing protein [Nitrospiria bacterium]|nr:thioredoxin domain-containing protein [Nitrospiria bacterium]
MTDRRANRLIKETSPYLRQHAYNPVDWHPWGKDALEKSRAEDKPILLSIGYSACHWCHVMEHESFEDDETAALMNQSYINIKVDREERPDLDQIYQTAFQLFHRRGGGWPLTMFLTPDLLPFFAGTYFPPHDRYNLPGFKRVLSSVAEAYRTQRDQVRQTTDQITRVFEQLQTRRSGDLPLSPDAVRQAVDYLSRIFEPVYGGFGGAPKFPASMAFTLCLHHHHATHDRTALEMTTRTLSRMADGGIYDQIGGGFHRYSVDERWLVPHFEKMLYDNALLTRLYLDTHLVTQDERFARIAKGTLNYALRELLHPDGGFYAAQDADSEGEEGKYFVWTVEEVLAVLGDADGRLFCRAFDVTSAGNFEKRNILHVALTADALAEEFRMTPEEVALRLEQGKGRLLAHRELRVKPLRDEKILVSWNGLMLSALAEAVKVFEIDAHRAAAVKTAEFLWTNLRRPVHGRARLLHVWTKGEAKITAFLDDYAFLIAAYLDLYEALLDTKWFNRALQLTEEMMEEYWDENEGDFFFTPRHHEPLISRPKSSQDQSIPSGTAVAVRDLLRLAAYTGRTDWGTAAERTLRRYQAEMEENPYGMASMLLALDCALLGPVEVVIAVGGSTPGTRQLLQQTHHVYLPNELICLVQPGESTPFAEALTKGRGPVGEAPAAYVCRQTTCLPPITSPTDLRLALTQPSAETKNS